MSSSKKKGSSGSPNKKPDVSHGLERPTGGGMIPQPILTGYYGPRGERLKHTVRIGALQMPKEVLTILRDESQSCAPLPTYAPKDLPGLDTVVRPMVDPSLPDVQVTYMQAKRVKVPASPVPGQDMSMMIDPPMKIVLQSVCENQTVHRDVPQLQVPPRIRGGGDNNNDAGGNSQTDEQVTPMEIDNDSTPAVEQGPADRVTDGHRDEPAAPASAPTQESAPAQAPTPPSNDQSKPTSVTSPEALEKSEVSSGSDPVVAPPPPSTAPIEASVAGVGPGLSAGAPPSSSAPVSSTAASAPSLESLPPKSETPTAEAITPAVAGVAVSSTVPPSSAAAPTPSLESAPAKPDASTAVTTETATPAPSVEVTSSTPNPLALASKLAEATSPTPPTSAVAESVAQTPAPPVATASSTTASASQGQTTPIPAVIAPPKVEPLKEQSASSWEQHIPNENDETLSDKRHILPKPDWYDPKKISDLERTMLPEWFDNSSAHRTPTSYMESRAKLVDMSDKMVNRNVTYAMARRVLLVDAGSVHRLRDFLTNWNVINEDGLNDSTPTPAVLRKTEDEKDSAQESATTTSKPLEFTDSLRDDLISAVVRHSKRQKIEHDNKVPDGPTFVPINWQAVADEVGNGASSSDCEREFLSLPLDTMMEEDEKDETSAAAERSITPDQSSSMETSGEKESASGKAGSGGALVSEMLQSVSSDVIREATAAALKASSGDLQKAQKAALAGIATSQAIENARSKEEALSLAMSELLSERMRKLEHRMTMLDDVEGMLEAERVALEIERRDFYTVRCRHWFLGG